MKWEKSLEDYKNTMPKTIRNEFDKNLTQVANDYLAESVRKMESISNIMNSMGILLVSAIIAWVVLGTFQMQDQITAAIS